MPIISTTLLHCPRGISWYRQNKGIRMGWKTSETISIYRWQWYIQKILESIIKLTQKEFSNVAGYKIDIKN